MSASMPMEALAPVAAALRRMGVEFYIGGSVACVRHGVPRSTVDVDLIANLRTEHAGALAEALDELGQTDEAAELFAQVGSYNFNSVGFALVGRDAAARSTG